MFPSSLFFNVALDELTNSVEERDSSGKGRGKSLSFVDKMFSYTKAPGQKEIMWDTLWQTIAPKMRIFFFSVLEAGWKGRGWIQGKRKMSGTGVHDVKFTKKKVVVFFLKNLTMGNNTKESNGIVWN